MWWCYLFATWPSSNSNHWVYHCYCWCGVVLVLVHAGTALRSFEKMVRTTTGSHAHADKMITMVGLLAADASAGGGDCGAVLVLVLAQRSQSHLKHQKTLISFAKYTSNTAKKLIPFPKYHFKNQKTLIPFAKISSKPQKNADTICKN